MKNLFRAVNDAWYDQQSVVNPDIEEFCFDSGFWSWIDVVDSDGNVVDDAKVITRQDLQEACDAIGIEFDCMNY